MRANLIIEQKAEHNSIKRFRISRRNTTDEQYSLWQTAGKVRGRLILKYTNTNTNTNTKMLECHCTPEEKVFFGNFLKLECQFKFSSLIFFRFSLLGNISHYIVVPGRRKKSDIVLSKFRESWIFRLRWMMTAFWDFHLFEFALLNRP